MPTLLVEETTESTPESMFKSVAARVPVTVRLPVIVCEAAVVERRPAEKLAYEILRVLMSPSLTMRKSSAVTALTDAN